MDLVKRKEFQDFYKQFAIRHYKKGEILIRADDDPAGIYCLMSGYVRKYSITSEGTELTLLILKPIAYFPMVWAINGTKNVYNYEAMTDVEVGRAPRDRVVQFIQDKPKITFDLMSELLDDYEETQTRMEYLAYSSAYKRVIAELMYLGKHLGKTTRRKRVTIEHKFTHQDIATLVGITRETASVVLKKLADEKLIEFQNHRITLKSEDLLKQELLKSKFNL